MASTGVANLVNSVINLAALREHARKELIQVLDSVCVPLWVQFANPF